MWLALWAAMACAERPEATVVRGDDVGAAACTEVELDPTAIDFGEVAVGDQATEAVEIANRGDASLEIHGLSLDGDDAYTLSSVSSVLLPAQGSATFDVTFAPEDLGVVEADVVVETNVCGDLELPLTGEGVE